MRLRAEGHEVRVWSYNGTPRKPIFNRYVGVGLASKIGTWPELLAWAKDGVRSRVPTIMLFDLSGMGAFADEARKAGIYTIGGGSFCDRLEQDRQFGQGIAQEAGCSLPAFEEFSSIDETIAFAEKMGDVPTYFKSDAYISMDATHGADTGEFMAEYLRGLRLKHGSRYKNILQQKIDGVPFSTERWWNGRAFVGPYYGLLEHKKAYNDDLGPSTGCSFNAIWAYDEPAIAGALHWENLTALFLKREAPAGVYDINAVITEDGDAYFLEWTPRLGYDSEMTAALLWSDLGRFLWTVASSQGDPGVLVSRDIAYSTRLGVPPYPWEDSKLSDKDTCMGEFVNGASDLGNCFVPYFLQAGRLGGYEVASPEGIVGLVARTGSALTKLHKGVMADTKKLRAAGLGYRTDGGDVLANDAKRVKAAGFEVHSGLLL
jgi:phosphoribosylamine-glycine ligase